MKLDLGNMNIKETTQTFLKIPIDQLSETKNVRTEYNAESIEELAKSIESVGLLQPLVVSKGMTDNNGITYYQVIAGHRRFRALEKLVKDGGDFSLVDCVIRTGRQDLLQMIENIQRDALTPRELEAFVRARLNEGMGQNSIANLLKKSVSWVSDVLAGANVREQADKIGISTEKIKSKTLSQLRTIPEEKRADAIKQLAENGGTIREATKILNDFKESDAPRFDAIQTAPAPAPIAPPSTDFEIDESESDNENDAIEESNDDEINNVFSSNIGITVGDLLDYIEKAKPPRDTVIVSTKRGTIAAVYVDSKENTLILK